MLTELESLPEQAHLEYAIKGEVVIGLSEILSGLTKVRLNQLAIVHQVAGRSKMKKEQLAEAVLERITDAAALSELLLKLESREQELIEGLLENSILSDALPEENYAALLEQGLVFMFVNQDGRTVVLPDDVKAAIGKTGLSGTKIMNSSDDSVSTPGVVRPIHSVHYIPNKRIPVVVARIGRNEPCICGSGRKYKKCCGK